MEQDVDQPEAAFVLNWISNFIRLTFWIWSPGDGLLMTFRASYNYRNLWRSNLKISLHRSLRINLFISCQKA